MNPYDPNTEPGTHFVADTLGISNVNMLNATYRPADPLYRASTRVIASAYELNERHDRVTVAAKDALRLFEPIGRGELGRARVSYALLRTSIPKLGELLTKQGRAYDQLIDAVSAYQRLQPEHSTTNSHEANREQRSGRDDDWAIEGDRQLKALEVVELGGLRLCRTAIGEEPYLSDGTGRRPQPLPSTVRRMVADGLLHQDTSENPHRPGQLLSLTSHGEAALRAARTATSRVSAALGRSHAPASPGPLANSAARPATPTVRNPAR
ncbi:large ATP-binding protein [Streptomyces sp. McG3]|uniref:large ATP-binding protein n=1 Tax=Streptomyces sp. McG3 TaxID=2725483 RepID=UPI001BEBBA13|nr:large ATP-binding protein [Streptomyces sp. McG3]MBT2896591.1 large ATP-binding protein [Streptomyces sp. McG3]